LDGCGEEGPRMLGFEQRGRSLTLL
jgi:hypothetical protein